MGDIDRIRAPYCPNPSLLDKHDLIRSREPSCAVDYGDTYEYKGGVVIRDVFQNIFGIGGTIARFGRLGMLVFLGSSGVSLRSQEEDGYKCKATHWSRHWSRQRGRLYIAAHRLTGSPAQGALPISQTNARTK